jgi:hypothetical protein
MFIVEEDLAVIVKIRGCFTHLRELCSLLKTLKQPLIFTITVRSSTMNITPLNECETAPNLHNHSKVFNNEHND